MEENIQNLSQAINEQEVNEEALENVTGGVREIPIRPVSRPPMAPKPVRPRPINPSPFGNIAEKLKGLGL